MRAILTGATLLQLNVRAFRRTFLNASMNRPSVLRQGSPFVDHREAMDICGGGIVEGEAAKRSQACACSRGRAGHKAGPARAVAASCRNG
jgi:hypothetical protein